MENIKNKKNIILEGVTNRQFKNPLRPKGWSKERIEENVDKLSLLSWNPKHYGPYLNERYNKWYLDKGKKRNYCKILYKP